MFNARAEIVPSLGLGGLLLGQAWHEVPWEQQWQELGTITRGSLAGGAIVGVGDSQSDRIIGLVAQSGYGGRLANGIGLGTPFAEALQRAPELRVHDLEPGLYEPHHLGYLLRAEETEDPLLEARVGSVLICDWGHDYWTFARPLLREEDVEW